MSAVENRIGDHREAHPEKQSVVSVLDKDAETEHSLGSGDNLKGVMIQVMKDRAEIVAAMSQLGLGGEDARPIGLSLFIART